MTCDAAYETVPGDSAEFLRYSVSVTTCGHLVQHPWSQTPCAVGALSSVVVQLRIAHFLACIYVRYPRTCQAGLGYVELSHVSLTLIEAFELCLC